MGLYNKAAEVKTEDKPAMYKGATGITYVNGINKTIMKRVAIFWFGPIVVKVMPDSDNKNLLVILEKEAESWQVVQFEKFWMVKIKVIK